MPIRSKKTLLLERKFPEVRNYKITPRHAEAAREAGLEHIPLVMRMAQKYRTVAWRKGIPLREIIQAGIIGLIAAKKKYVPEKGEFVNYATKYIKGYILKYLYSTGKISLAMYGNIYNIEKTLNLWKRKQAGEDISKSLEKSGKHVNELFARIKSEEDFNSLADKVHELRQLYYFAENPRSLNEWVIQDGDPMQIQETIPDSEESAFSKLSLAEQKARLRLLINKLYPSRSKLRKIIDLRYLSETPLTEREIAKKWRVTRGRVRQMEKEVLRKLKRGLQK